MKDEKRGGVNVGFKTRRSRRGRTHAIVRLSLVLVVLSGSMVGLLFACGRAERARGTPEEFARSQYRLKTLTSAVVDAVEAADPLPPVDAATFSIWVVIDRVGIGSLRQRGRAPSDVFFGPADEARAPPDWSPYEALAGTGIEDWEASVLTSYHGGDFTSPEYVGALRDGSVTPVLVDPGFEGRLVVCYSDLSVRVLEWGGSREAWDALGLQHVRFD